MSNQLLRLLLIPVLLISAGFSMRCECTGHSTPQTRFVGVHCCDDEGSPVSAPAESIGNAPHGCVDAPFVVAKANLSRMGHYGPETPLPAKAIVAGTHLAGSDGLLNRAVSAPRHASATALDLPAERCDLLQR